MIKQEREIKNHLISLSCFNLVPIIIFFLHQFSPPLKCPHEAFLLYQFFHFIIFHEVMHGLFIHHSFIKPVIQQIGVQFRFHLRLYLFFYHQQILLPDVIIRFGRLPVSWTWQYKTYISSLFPRCTFRMRHCRLIQQMIYRADV